MLSGFNSSLKLLVIFVFFFSGFSFSQQSSYLDSLSGKYALQFQIADNFQLASFQGATFSGKYHLNNFSAVRLGLTTNLNNQNRGTDYQLLDTTYSAHSDGSNHGYSFTIDAQYIFYIETLNEVSFYCGAGPEIGYYFNKQNSSTANPDTSITSNQTSKNFSVGLDFIGGVEWMFSKRMSLSAEYGLSFYYQKNTASMNDPNTIIQTNNKSFNINPGYVKFGLSVYF